MLPIGKAAFVPVRAHYFGVSQVCKFYTGGAEGVSGPLHEDPWASHSRFKSGWRTRWRKENAEVLAEIRESYEKELPSRR
jgi:hypothetical protein